MENSNTKRPRNRIDLFTQTEVAIYAAQQAVEHAGAHVKLTEAGIKLQQARDLVADWIDETTT